MNSSTKNGTQNFAQKFQKQGLPKTAYRTLGRTGLVCSAVGFGGYRVDDVTEDHRMALKKALLSGCNLIDTSTNYSDGGSERLVGQVIGDLTKDNSIVREEMIVVSKVGYIQGKNLSFVRTKAKTETGYPDIVQYMKGCWHCLHPNFIEDQLTASLERLQLKKLDVLLLHNPEYFLLDQKKNSPDSKIEDRFEEFYRRIQLAFVQLEKEVKNNRISWYGVSSNTFVNPTESQDGTSISRMWDIANKIGGVDHHFAIVQLPANLLESGAMREKNNDGLLTPLEFAKKHNLGVLINRPLNAIVGKQLTRLADFSVDGNTKPIEESLQRAIHLESQFVERVGKHLNMAPNSPSPADLFGWATRLKDFDLQGIDYNHWKQLETQAIRPQLGHVCEALTQQLPSALQGPWQEWSSEYLPTMVELLDAIKNQCAKRAQKTSEEVSKTLNTHIPESLRKQPLSRKAVATLLNTSGINCVLAGMREERYVADIIETMKFPDFEVSEEVYGAFN